MTSVPQMPVPETSVPHLSTPQISSEPADPGGVSFHTVSRHLKFMAALAGVVALVAGTAGVLAERAVHKREQARIARDLEQRAQLIQEILGDTALAHPTPAVDEIADRTGRVAGVRVTLIAPDGSVVGDSDVPSERLGSIENHADRREVAAALKGLIGEDTRRSHTVGRALHYHAIPVDPTRNAGVIRVAVEASDLEVAAQDLSSVFLAAGGIGLLAAALVSWGLSRLAGRRIRELERLTSAIADGELGDRIPRSYEDELGTIRTSIHRMADQLRDQLERTAREKVQLRAVLDSMVEGVLVVDQESRIVLTNERLDGFFGVSGDLRGRSLLEVIRHPDLDEALRAAAATDQPVARRIEVSRPARRTLQLHAVRFPAHSPQRLHSSPGG